MESLLIQFRDNDTAHDDLHVLIEGYSRTTDSYYLALDRAMLAGEKSAEKARRVLIQLLQRWMEALAQATPTQPVYLPFDFSLFFALTHQVTNNCHSVLLRERPPGENDERVIAEVKENRKKPTE